MTNTGDKKRLEDCLFYGRFAKDCAEAGVKPTVARYKAWVKVYLEILKKKSRGC